jgi:hypothetical protein
MSKYPLLDNKEWLYSKYIQEYLGFRAICKLVGAQSTNSVRQSLIKHSIPIRTIGDGIRINRVDDGFIINKEVIEGCLLGDGFLCKWNKKNDNSFPYFAKRNKYYDHIIYVSRILFGNKWKERTKENDEKSLGKRHVVFTLRSLSNKLLQSFYKRWYPEWNNYKKVIPDDIDITPTLLLHWFLDDGNSYQRRKNSSTKQIVITLCSECFNKDDQQMIVEKINYIFGLVCTLKKVNYGTGYQIRIPQSQASLFYDIIGPCPVPSMKYKWK